MSATITAAGRVVKEGEVKPVGNSEVLNVRVAVDRGYRDNKQTDFFTLAIWGKLAGVMAPMLTRGKFVVFSGEFGTRDYEYKGEKRLELQVRVDRLELGPADSGDRRAAGAGSSQNNGRQAGGSAAVTDDLEDDIPF